MEDQRSLRSGPFYVRESGARAGSISKTAGVSVAALILVVGWLAFSNSSAKYVRSEQPSGAVVAASAPDAAAFDAADLSSIAASANMEVTAEDLSMIGPSVVGALVSQYQSLKESGAYSREAAAAAAEQLGESAYVPVPYKKYTSKDIHTSTDNSYAAMLKYRASLKNALAPMAELENFELGTFAKYSATKDPAYLAELRSTVATYTSSTKAAEKLVVPEGAAQLHANILNAMGQFASVLEGLTDNADNPITTLVLLRTYNEAESSMLTSFNNLAMYFAHHPQS